MELRCANTIRLHSFPLLFCVCICQLCSENDCISRRVASIKIHNFLVPSLEETIQSIDWYPFHTLCATVNVNHIKMIRLFFKVFYAVSIVDVKFAQSLMSTENPSSIFRLPLFFIDNFCVQYFPLSSSHDSRFVLFCLCNIGISRLFYLAHWVRSSTVFVSFHLCCC